MYIFNSQSRQKEQLRPIQEGVVRLYLCGPTVYDDAHLGHARSAVAFDLLHRTLLALEFKVIFARNITDIDDKIIAKMQKEDRSLKELTLHYIDRFHADMAAIGILPPTVEPKATESLDAMFELIEALLEKGIAYTLSNGDIYFSVDKDEGYGSLSGKGGDEETQSRVEEVSEKRNERDFALWKAAKDGESVSFESPFGKGRPGWHLECSAMIKKHLSADGAVQIDIHGGGSDLLFPHHENEAAQTRCGYAQELAKIWMHNGFVNIDGQKMSKSLDNSFFLKDALKVYSGELVRFYLQGVHYRANFNFAEEDMISSKKRLDKIYRLKKRLYGQKPSALDESFKNSILEPLVDDLNISVTMSVVDEFIAAANEALDKNPKDNAFKATTTANILFIAELLGFGDRDAYEYFQEGVDDEQKKLIESLIAKRAEAKAAKDFATADGIRAELVAMGIALMDTPNGTVWEKSS